MADPERIVQPAPTPAETVEQVVAGVEAMTIASLRSEWRRTFGSDAPPAFSKDILARALAYQIQEEVYGGLSAATARLLRALLKPGAEPPWRVKVGSVIVREHKGVLHEVLITPEGFCWRGQTFGSLSTIAKKITGTSWNGPRFFGLRAKEIDKPESSRASAGSIDGANGGSPRNAPEVRKRTGHRSSVRMASARSGAAP